jgi:hypothetical protein
MIEAAAPTSGLPGNLARRMTRMSARKITIQLDDKTAKAWDAASEEERRRIESRLRLEAWRALNAPTRSLDDVMNDMARQARERGLTEERLEEILNER